MRLSEKNVTINESKSVEFMDEISFLGFKISSRGIAPDERLVNRIRALKAPQNKQEVEYFIGLINYFGRLIPNFTQKMGPISALRNTKAKFLWTQECNDAFESLCREVASSPVVQPYDPEKEATLWTDASQNCIAAVLTQNQHPVIFISRTLSKAETRYSNIEREALAIVWAITRLKHFLAARYFTVATDHRPLENLFHPSKPVPVNKTSPRIARWTLLLMQYDFNIKYVAGKDIPHADALSRLRYTSDSVPEDSECNDFLSLHSIHYERSVIPHSEIRSELVNDSFMQRIGWRVTTGRWGNCSQAEMPFKHVKERLTIESGALYYDHRVFIPIRLRQRVFNKVHEETHAGMKSAIQRLKSTSWWPNMTRDIERYVRNCQVCQTIRPQSSRTVDRWPPAAPFQRIHIDWASITDVGNVLIIVDSGSGWIEAFRCRDRTSETVIKCLRAVFSRFGVPELIVSDNAQEFVSEAFNTWLNAIGASKMETPPYFPRANGSAERAVQTVKRAMGCWKDTKQDFDSFLQRVLFNHRIASTSRGRSPAEIVFGRSLRAPVVSSFSQGETLIYKPTSKSIPSKVQFLMSKGRNTSWVIISREDKPQIILASNNQLSFSNYRHTEQSTQNHKDTPITRPTSDDGGTFEFYPEADEDPKAPIRRSTRTVHPPERYGVVLSQ